VVIRPARLVSEGTLRLLALCAVAANHFNRGLVAFEEPENGVHPRRIHVVTRLLAEASRRQQVIVTMHSPLVFEEILQLIQQGELSPDQVRLVRCISTPEGSAYMPFQPHGPLFADTEISEALAGSDDQQILQSMLVRGWLDG
jgi:hypothetical protein